MELNFRTYGDRGDYLVIVHGLYGSMSNWNRLANQFAEHYRVITPDLRNHGRSQWHDDHEYEALAEDLAELIDTHAEGKAHVIGHSMGGKAAMMFALLYPEKLQRLIIADIAPVQYERSDHIEIMSAMQRCIMQSPKSRSDVDLCLASELNHRPNNEADKATRAFLLQNLIKDEAGNYAWRINIATLSNYERELRFWPNINSSYNGATLFLYGERSDYVLPKYYDDIEHYFPNYRLEGIPNAGHWLHAEQPQTFFDACIRFLNA